MLYYHPKNVVGSFIPEAENFLEHNDEHLKKLLDESIDLVQGTIDDNDVMEKRSSLIFIACWNNMDSIYDITEEIAEETEKEKGTGVFMEFFHIMNTWCCLQCMINLGLLEKNDGIVKTSLFGKEYFARNIYKKGIHEKHKKTLR